MENHKAKVAEGLRYLDGIRRLKLSRQRKLIAAKSRQRRFAARMWGEKTCFSA